MLLTSTMFKVVYLRRTKLQQIKTQYSAIKT